MTEPGSTAKGFDFNQPTIVALLYLASLVTGLTMLIGLVMAHVWKDDVPGSWETSHFRFHIRTFWVGLVLGILAVVPTILTLGLAGFLIYPLLIVWVAIRTVRAMLTAQNREPVANVETWLW